MWLALTDHKSARPPRSCAGSRVVISMVRPLDTFHQLLSLENQRSLGDPTSLQHLNLSFDAVCILQSVIVRWTRGLAERGSTHVRNLTFRVQGLTDGIP
jgi:hypothetical protein